MPALPFMANLPIPGIPGVFTPETPAETQSGSSEGINAGDSNFGPDEANTGSSEPTVDETAAETDAGTGSEVVSEATGEGETEAVNAGEGEAAGSGSEVDTEASIGLGSLPQVESCVDLAPAACHGRVDYNPCIIDQ